MSNVDDKWLETFRRKVETAPVELPEGGAGAFCAEAARIGRWRSVRKFAAAGLAAAAAVAAFLILQPAFQPEDLRVAENNEGEELQHHPVEVSDVPGVAFDDIKDDEKPPVCHRIDRKPSAETHQVVISSEVSTDRLASGTSEMPSDISTADSSSTVSCGNVTVTASGPSDNPTFNPLSDTFARVEEDDCKKRTSVRSVSYGLHLAFDDDASHSSGISQHSVVSKDQYFSSPRSAFLYKGYHTDYEYFKPFNIGLNFSLALTDRLSLETGFDYSLHRSRLHNFLNSTELDSDMQILHFVGIPLGIRVVAFESGRSSVYGYAGAKTQKCVYASWNGSRMNIRPVILSTHLSAGWQFEVADCLALYAEPGISYYDAVSDANYTIYSKSPWQFELRAGLRFIM